MYMYYTYAYLLLLNPHAAPHLPFPVTQIEHGVPSHETVYISTCIFTYKTKHLLVCLLVK